MKSYFCSESLYGNLLALKEELQEIINDSGINAICEIVNNGQVIAINGNGTRIWLRLRFKEDKMIIDVSSIEIPLKHRRHGAFSKMFSTMKNKEYVEEVRITNVCTQEMEKFCNKNKLTYNGDNNYYV